MNPLVSATTRLLSSADDLSDGAWSAPSHCAGWTRAHVLAHLALNAEALTGVLVGLRDAEAVPMYPSQDQRDADIATLATAAPGDIRTRLRAACVAFDEASSVVPSLPDAATFERMPGGLVLPGRVVPGMRLREVEIHHADLDVGYTASDWPQETAMRFLSSDAKRHTGPGFHAVATDEPAGWTFGEPGPDSPTVSGPLGALAWWATGRDPGPVLSSTNGTLPTMEGR